ncbi:YppG family protein [Bacillus sp. LBG-1-113]|uniref:YppG family protein n=1 Tax=Bacillus sp. LBG-1-113 TaxID=2886094 RepID=UPI001E47ACCE|nr:YppG family protein [Bacillus sp. LBG-1-113]MCC2928756.1 YppG family protein [Bacillus sp. LBG-1-113]
MERRPQNNPRQLGYYYPQQMQVYYHQNAPVHSEPYVPQHYGQQEFYQPYIPPQSMPMQPPVFPNPYPIARPNQQQPSQVQSIMSQFKKANGQFDFNKMMDTTGQVMSAMNQVGSLIKGFTSFFK